MSSPEPRRRRLALGVLALVAALLLVWLLALRPSRTRTPQPTTPPPAPSAPQGKPGPEPGQAAARLSPAQAMPPPETPIIDEIIVEKQEVCAGEENLITVKAHTPTGKDDAFLHYMVVSATGASVPLRLEKRSDEQTRGVKREIIVFGRDNVAAKKDLPPYTIKDCVPDRQLFIDYRVLANTVATFEIRAEVRNLAAVKAMKMPIKYRWSFGDGQTAETAVPFIEHDFSARPQRALYSQLLIGCEAVAADGEKVLGRRMLQLLNSVFEDFHYKGVVRLLTQMSPRFPRLDRRGVVEQEVRIFHLREDAVRVTQVQIVRHPKVRGAATTVPQPERANAESVLGTLVIPPGDGITVKVSFDAKTHSDIFSVDYLIEGESADGWPAGGNFSLMRPPELPTRDNSDPVHNPLLKAKILRAREVLGQEYVTDDDLIRLDQEGRFDDLKGDPEIKRQEEELRRNPPPPPANLPKPPRMEEGAGATPAPAP